MLACLRVKIINVCTEHEYLTGWVLLKTPLPAVRVKIPRLQVTLGLLIGVLCRRREKSLVWMFSMTER